MKRMIAGVGAVALLGAFVLAAAQSNAPAARLEIKAVSTDPSRVTGGDLLVQIAAPSGSTTVRVTADGKDVTSAFKPTATALIGLVTGLANGPNVITAEAGGQRASLEVTNYPITGP